VDAGENPELELTRFLTERRRFPFSAPLAGHVEFKPTRGETMTIGVLHGFVPSQSDAWKFTLEDVDRYYDRVSAEHNAQPPPDLPRKASELAALDIPAEVSNPIGGYAELARLLGQRTAEMHLALGSDTESAAFKPEEFTQLYQRAIYQAFRGQTVRTVGLIKRKASTIPDDVRADALRILEREEQILKRFHAVVGRKFSGMRIRQHGDYHLGQVLFTGRDFVIIDFEGEPARPIGERRIKRSPLRDAAGMLRSFDYAAYAALFHRLNGAGPESPEFAVLEPWARLWAQGVSAAFFRAYVDTIRRSDLLPSSARELDTLLEVFLLEKALYELAYELNNRPGWVRVPIMGVTRLLQ
jgi:maltose alpha-D-glucosyltransferase/alpha-amylase